ncbi:hypothetical protein MASR2M39_17320 [Ignavibacteriales bacterium]
MAKDTKERKIGKKGVDKPQPEWLVYYKKNKSWIQGVIFTIIVIFFLILNNTRNEPEQGNYPPGITADSVNTLMKSEPVKPDTSEKDTVILK